MPLPTTKTETSDPVLYGQRTPGKANREFGWAPPGDPLWASGDDNMSFRRAWADWNIGKAGPRLYCYGTAPLPREEDVKLVLDRVGIHSTDEPEQQLISAMHRAGYTVMAHSLGYLSQNHQIPHVTTYRVDHNHPGGPSLPAETGEPDSHLPTLRQWFETYLETYLGNNPRMVKPGYEHRPGQFSIRSKPGWVDIEKGGPVPISVG